MRETVSAEFTSASRNSQQWQKNGKPYDNVILQDKTGVLDGKIWDPNSLGIDDFDTLDYIDVVGDVTTFAGAMQLNIKRVRKASEGEYNPADYLPVSENSTDDMYGQILNNDQNSKKWIPVRTFE